MVAPDSMKWRSNVVKPPVLMNATTVLVFMLVMCCAPIPGVLAQPSYDFGECAPRSAAQYDPGPIVSRLITMRDGVRIAVDVILPKGLLANQRVPAVLTLTRYWRAREDDGPSEFQRFWVSHGYAIVSADVRGTGASFGGWRYSRSIQEIRDYGEIIAWVGSQPWSNGRTGITGTSYGANAAELALINDSRGLKAVIPRHSDFDVYNHVYFPGGILNFHFSENWSDTVRKMDLNIKLGRPGGTLRGVRPVDGDLGGDLLLAAIKEHTNNPPIFAGLKEIIFRDDRPAVWGASMEDWTAFTHRAEIERSNVPMMVWGSWLDAGTADGALLRFLTFKNPQRVVIGPWSHGGRFHSSPFLPRDTANNPELQVQWLEDLCFFDRHLKYPDARPAEREVIYYTMNEERWKRTRVWPPAGSSKARWYLASESNLSPVAPQAESEVDHYAVDFEATTGTANRWQTQFGGGDVFYPDRAEADRRLLVYTSLPLRADLEITGHPIVKLFIKSTATDGAFFVYLEDVDPTGRVTYITEGELRALHRKVSRAAAPYRSPAPYHTFHRRDASPLTPGEMNELHFGLLPVSVLVKRGHRLRVAIGGGDKDTFVRIPSEGTPTITVGRNRQFASYVELPVIQLRRGGRKR